MNLNDIIENAYLPAIRIIGVRDTETARVQMLAIGLQESRFQFRRQMGNGPAMGFWQFERGGGVKGVLTHSASKVKAAALCKSRAVAFDAMAVWLALENDDILAAGFARLLLLTDPRALPEVTDIKNSWDCYIRNWQPGKPHPKTWMDCHLKARTEVLENPIPS